MFLPVHWREFCRILSHSDSLTTAVRNKWVLAAMSVLGCMELATPETELAGSGLDGEVRGLVNAATR